MYNKRKQNINGESYFDKNGERFAKVGGIGLVISKGTQIFSDPQYIKTYGKEQLNKLRKQYFANANG